MQAKRRKSLGFTLVELMMVVAILGILAAIAVPRYISYVYKSKTAEAVGFLSEIKARQESYRADFGEYASPSSSLTDYYPTGNPTNKPRVWDETTATGKLWSQLGAVPPGRQVLFSYSSLAGRVGTIAPVPGYTGSDFWFVSRALGDLDNDGVRVVFESYSHGQGLYIDNAAGWE